jgi:hypothetical protein
VCGDDLRASLVKLDTDRLEEELERIVLSDLRQLVGEDGKWRELWDVPSELASALAAIDGKRLAFRSIYDPDSGELTGTEELTIIRVRFHDKLGAINTLLKMRGMLDRNVHVKGEIVLDVKAQARADARKLSTEQLERICALFDQVAVIEAEDR